VKTAALFLEYFSVLHSVLFVLVGSVHSVVLYFSVLANNCYFLMAAFR
jgi:hypothetical protein